MHTQGFLDVMGSFFVTPLFSPGLLPVCSLGVNQVGRLNLGRDVSTLRYFTVCGLQESYEPFAVTMAREPSLWMSRRQPQFVPVPPEQNILVSYGCNINQRILLSENVSGFAKVNVRILKE